jgi:dTDP-4-dehydrorhamnose reductase
MTDIIIFGAGGQLGRELSLLFPEAYKVYHKDKSGTIHDIDNSEFIRDIMALHKPDIVINAAALANVDLCEKNNALAYQTNGKSVGTIAKYSRMYNSLLVHVSTDYVFDGKTGNYDENAIPNPINYYGTSKLIGDIYALGYENSIIVRTSGVFGHTNNFPKFVLKNLSEGKEINAIKGFYSPIHARFLAMAISHLIKKDFRGIVNVAGDRISRFDLAMRIAQIFGLNSDLIHESEPPSNMIAKRPFDSSLDIRMASALLGIDFHSTQKNIELMTKE